MPPTARLFWDLWLVWDVPGVILHPKASPAASLDNSLAFFVPNTAALLPWAHLDSSHPFLPLAGPSPAKCEEGRTNSLVIPEGAALGQAQTSLTFSYISRDRQGKPSGQQRHFRALPEGTWDNFLLHLNVFTKSLLSFIHMCKCMFPFQIACKIFKNPNAQLRVTVRSFAIC